MVEGDWAMSAYPKAINPDEQVALEREFRKQNGLPMQSLLETLLVTKAAKCPQCGCPYTMAPGVAPGVDDVGIYFTLKCECTAEKGA